MLSKIIVIVLACIIEIHANADMLMWQLSPEFNRTGSSADVVYTFSSLTTAADSNDDDFRLDADDSMLSPWSPEKFYIDNGIDPVVNSSRYDVVPVPSSGLLSMLGFAILMLKRNVKFIA